MRRLTVGRILSYVLLAAIVIVALAPIVWIILNAFKARVDVIAYPPKLFFTPTLANFERVLQIGTITRGVTNSLIVVPLSLLIGAIFAIPTAYVFARYAFKAKNDLRFFVLSLRFMPPVAAVIPFFIVWLQLGMLDTRAGLIITYLGITISTMLWLSIASFQRVPIEYEEAAQLEGLGSLGVFLRIALPIALPSLLGMAIFVFILAWNEFFLAFVLTSRQAVTMPVAAATFAVMGMEVPWGQLSASIALLMVPPMILSYFFMRYLPSIFGLGTEE